MSCNNKSTEDYLETILMLKERSGSDIRSIDIVRETGYTKPSISIAMKKLKENGYINVDGKGYIELTKAGEDIAENIYGKHRTLTDYFIRIGVDSKIAEQDACLIEHEISEETFACIKKELAKIKAEQAENK